MPKPKGDGGPAFPCPHESAPELGMSLRDYFAAKVAPTYKWYSYGEITAYRENNKITAEKCYLIADALLEAREVSDA